MKIILLTILIAFAAHDSLAQDSVVQRNINGWTVFIHQPSIKFGEEWSTKTSPCEPGVPKVDFKMVEAVYFEALVNNLTLPKPKIADSVLHIKSRHQFNIWCNEDGGSGFGATAGFRVRDTFIVMSNAIGNFEVPVKNVASVPRSRKELYNHLNWTNIEIFKDDIRNVSVEFRKALNQQQRRFRVKE